MTNDIGDASYRPGFYSHTFPPVPSFVDVPMLRPIVMSEQFFLDWTGRPTTPPVNPPLAGWVCPVCGRGVAPCEKSCPCKEGTL